MVGELIRKYIWLIETLRSSGSSGLTINELISKYEDSFGEEYSRSSFNNHRSAIEEIFGIAIKCRRSDNTYYIPYSGDVMDRSASSEWLIDTFTVNNLLTLGTERLSGRVAIEDIPSGHRHLPMVMEALKGNLVIRIEYGKYGQSGSDIRHVRPYAVKEFDRRWYVVGFAGELGEMRVYALDRIRKMEVTGERFSFPEDFDVDAAFHDSYGVYLPEKGQKAETIVFRVSSREASYLRDLPLHHSQRETGSGEGTVDFSIRVIPNDNLIMNLCRYGPRIEVLQPPGVREKVASALKEAAGIYEKK